MLTCSSEGGWGAWLPRSRLPHAPRTPLRWTRDRPAGRRFGRNCLYCNCPYRAWRRPGPDYLGGRGQSHRPNWEGPHVHQGGLSCDHSCTCKKEKEKKLQSPTVLLAGREVSVVLTCWLLAGGASTGIRYKRGTRGTSWEREEAPREEDRRLGSVEQGVFRSAPCRTEQALETILP